MTNHAMGTWTANACLITGKDDSDSIAQVFYRNRSLDEAESIARLIAAAPELLAALEGLKAEMEQFSSVESLECCTAYVVARKAINKAKGLS